jgi:calcineurin-like phosphoesterase family protein
MAIFFTSDSHFGHANIIKYCNRPFSSVAEMDREMIEQWNKVVTMYDTVYHLGDFCFSAHAPYFNQLNGNKFLILGNHDTLNNARTAAWKNIYDYFELRTVSPENKKESYVLMPYSMRVWNKSHH